MTILRREHTDIDGDGRVRGQVYVIVNTETNYVEVATRSQPGQCWGPPLVQTSASDEPAALAASARSRADL